MRILFFVFLFVFFAFAKEFKVASYNVENLFDLVHDKTEYSEFIPNHKFGWTKQIHDIKIKNTSKVLADLNADIVGLVEIESKKALEDLMNGVKLYKYGYFLKNQDSAIGLAIISKYKITKTLGIKIDSNSKMARHILEADIDIEGKSLKVFVNHWKSKKSPESDRLEYASALQERIKQLPSNSDYIILGDLNSNYNEFETFKSNKKLNDTKGITGINNILKTTIDDNLVTFNKFLETDDTKYNLWLELPNNERFSEHYKGGANTPDNIIIPKAMFDNKNISYKQNSFGVFKRDYFFKNGKILRWKMDGKKHAGDGYSDHLPVYAIFSTDVLYKNEPTPNNKKTKNISTIYFQDELDKDSILHDVVVLFKNEKTTIIKQVIDRSVVVYGENNLSIGNVYDIKIKDIGTFYGLSEIKDMEIITDKGKFSNPKKLYLDANKIDIFNPKYTNEIIYNLLAYYSKGHLLFNDKKIKLYAKNKKILPRNNQIVRLNFGHLAVHNTKPQIIIYSKDNYAYVS